MSVELRGWSEIEKAEFSFPLDKLQIIPNKKGLTGKLELILSEDINYHFYTIDLELHAEDDDSTMGNPSYIIGKYDFLEEAKKDYKKYKEALNNGNYQITFTVTPRLGGTDGMQIKLDILE